MYNLKFHHCKKVEDLLKCLIKKRIYTFIKGFFNIKTREVTSESLTLSRKQKREWETL